MNLTSKSFKLRQQHIIDIIVVLLIFPILFKVAFYIVVCITNKRSDFQSYGILNTLYKLDNLIRPFLIIDIIVLIGIIISLSAYSATFFSLINILAILLKIILEIIYFRSVIFNYESAPKFLQKELQQKDVVFVMKSFIEVNNEAEFKTLSDSFGSDWKLDANIDEDYKKFNFKMRQFAVLLIPTIFSIMAFDILLLIMNVLYFINNTIKEKNQKINIINPNLYKNFSYERDSEDETESVVVSM
eukprot:GAHX01002928.1.p1 GENE.GAHX01002928.1~~GAHX01002928.1.p1  ORF type:complete len:244 (+),score=50.82 GAHX01002928.1:27-758(+)